MIGVEESGSSGTSSGRWGGGVGEQADVTAVSIANVPYVIDCTVHLHL